jgi:hypothetical protein
MRWCAFTLSLVAALSAPTRGAQSQPAGNSARAMSEIDLEGWRGARRVIEHKTARRSS